jgi:predicted MFS family arabinose efflux permease
MSNSAARISIAYSLLTLSDGALRMIVLFHYSTLGYNALSLAGVFAIYELCGVIVNLFGGVVAQRLGLLTTMRLGLILQIITLIGIAIPSQIPPVAYLMVLQGFAGIAKDLTKISAKSAMTAMNEQQSGLFGAIALLTGAKNTLKGVGFFVGGLLFVAFGMRVALGGLAGIVAIGLGLTLTLASTTGSAKIKQFAGIFAHSAAVNRLSVARFFLFGARDIWLAIALPLFMASAPGWGFWQSGAVMALYTIGYGVVQASTPRILAGQAAPDGRLTALLAGAPLLVCLGSAGLAQQYGANGWGILAAVCLFSLLFALNSAVHSYLIAAYAARDAISLNIGFYYSANSLGRLVGTLLSGWCYMQWGIVGSMAVAGLMFIPAAICAWPLPAPSGQIAVSAGDE